MRFLLARHSFVWLLVALLLSWARPCVACDMIVEDVRPHGAAARAELEVGDILVDWYRHPCPPSNPGAAFGEIDSPFALVALEIEQAPRGTLELGPGIDFVHFACHGFFDPVLPLASGILLTSGNSPEDGLLQAWEVFESLRIDASMVTLSACETGLGAEMGGEGLVGLTQAFHFAGARSVLSSLWRVGDETTSELMGLVYAGLSMDKARLKPCSTPRGV